ncbi:MAG: O-antigen ligase family protein [Vicinamibacterales bacterium]
MSSFVYFLGAAVAPAALLAGLALFKRPQWVPALLLLTATLTPWSAVKGVTPALALTLVATLVTIVATTLGSYRRSLPALGQRRATLAFAVAALVSALLGWLGAEQEVVNVIRAEWIPVQAGQLAAIVMGPAALLLTARFLNTRQTLVWMVWSYVALTMVGLLASLTLGMETNLRGLILTWSAVLMLGQLLYNSDLRPGVRALLVVAFAVTMFVKVVLGLTWVSGWLPTLVGCTTIAAFRWPKSVLSAVLIGTLVIVLAGDSLRSDYDREYEESGATRLGKWTLVLGQPFVWNHALFGTGPANYAVYFTVYTPNDRMSTHNNYLDIFLQLGIVGVVLVLVLLAAIARLALRLSRDRLDDPFLTAYARSSLGGIAAVVVAMGLGDWFTPFVFNQGLAGFSWTVQSWIFFGALCAIPAVLNGRFARTRAFRFDPVAPRSTPAFAEPVGIRLAGARDPHIDDLRSGRRPSDGRRGGIPPRW